MNRKLTPQDRMPDMATIEKLMRKAKDMKSKEQISRDNIRPLLAELRRKGLTFEEISDWLPANGGPRRVASYWSRVLHDKILSSAQQKQSRKIPQ